VAARKQLWQRHRDPKRAATADNQLLGYSSQGDSYTPFYNLEPMQSNSHDTCSKCKLMQYAGHVWLKLSSMIFSDVP
jgi:hypothetical protein